VTAARQQPTLRDDEMDWPAQCAVVIPCLNEAAAIESLVRQTRDHLPAVIVVDDGSTDDTGERAARAGAEVLRHDQPQGKGAALQTGLKRARARGFAWAMTLDGDGQHSPEDIPVFLQHAGRTGAALIIGNRMADAGGMPWLRRQVNRWMSRRLSRLAGRTLPDTQCGFRLFKLDAWSRLPIATRHFEIESEMLLAFIGASHLIEFIPIQVIYKAEQSKIHPWRDTVRWFRWLRARRKG
jgi:glycosyltransferase involved in cell wall biosynthesis